VALDPGSTPEQWMEAGVNVLVHKVPDEPGRLYAVRIMPGGGGDISSREREVAQDLLAAAATAAGNHSSSYRGDSTAHPLTGLPTD
jgi:hypothetical protein